MRGSVGTERKKIVKKSHQKRGRKGCMKGKGGPENALCTYRGVRQRTWGKWVAEIREPNRGSRIWIGTFGTSIEAALAYDDVARKIYGSTAKVNLPESIIKPSSTDENVLSRVTRPEDKLPLISVEQKTESAFSSSSNDVNGGGGGGGEEEMGRELKGSLIEGEGNSVISEVDDDDEVGQFFESLTLNLPEVDESLWVETTVVDGGGGGGYPITVDESGISNGESVEEMSWEALTLKWNLEERN